MADPVTLDQAYEIVFGTPAGIMVLRDLAAETGFLACMPPGTSTDVLVDHNAARRTFGRIYEILTATEQGREAMAEALRPAATQE